VETPAQTPSDIRTLFASLLQKNVLIMREINHLRMKCRVTTNSRQRPGVRRPAAALDFVLI
jgi:hypothetical protein